MKNVYFCLLIAVISLSAIYCSENRNFPGRMSPEERALQLKEVLDLTDEQTKEVEQIYTESQKKMAELRDQYEGDRSQMRELMMAHRDETNKKIEEILYEDQIPVYREYLEERREFRRGQREQRRRQD